MSDSTNQEAPSLQGGRKSQINTVKITMKWLLPTLIGIMIILTQQSQSTSPIQSPPQLPFPPDIPSINSTILFSPVPTTIPYPEPAYIPTLRPMDCYNKNDEIWHPCSPSDYIIPNNEWVQYYVNRVKNNEPISLYYKTDKELYPYASNDDVWQNADYTAYTRQGDCEDLSILWVSIHRSLGRKAIVVGGYLEDVNGKWIPDFWYEYIDEYGHFTKIVSESAMMTEYKLVPKYMFNDKISWSRYNEDWYYN